MEALRDLEHWLLFVVAVVIFFYTVTHFGGHFWE